MILQPQRFVSKVSYALHALLLLLFISVENVTPFFLSTDLFGCARLSHTHETQLQSHTQAGRINIYLSRRNVIGSILTGSTTAATAATVLTSPSIAKAATRDPKTGILLPSQGEIESSIPQEWDEDDNPFTSVDRSSFARLDSSPDTIFYSEPRFVEHVDEQAVESMTSYISDKLLHTGDSVLDLCSSWTSHIRPSSLQLKRLAGLGMNAKELEANSALTEWVVLDLNVDQDVKLPYDDGSFDVVMCQLSIDYLVNPLKVMKDAARVLKVRAIFHSDVMSANTRNIQTHAT